MGTKLLTPEELAEMLGVSPSTIRWWRSEGRGPRATKVGRLLRYDEADVRAWIEERKEDEVPGAVGA